MKSGLKYYIGRILLFCTIDLNLNFLFLFIWRQSSTPSILQGLSIVCMPFILTIIMARYTDGLNRIKASILAIILMISNCVSLIAINVINPFGRTITLEEYKDGIFRDITSTLLFFIPVSILLANVFMKKPSSLSFIEEEKTDDKNKLN